MKDNDLKSKIFINQKESYHLYKQIKKDTNFLLQKMNVMDYSLLICVVKSNINPNESLLNVVYNNSKHELIRKFQITSVNVPSECLFGIVDFLQEWNIEKRIEQIYKVYFKRHDKDGLSCVEPVYYKDRFLSKCAEVFDVVENDVIEV